MPGLGGVRIATANSWSAPWERRTVNVNFGIRSLLFIAATLLFLFAVYSDTNQGDLVAWGLAVFAFSFVIGDLGWDRRYGTGTTTVDRP